MSVIDTSVRSLADTTDEAASAAPALIPPPAPALPPPVQDIPRPLRRANTARAIDGAIAQNRAAAGPTLDAAGRPKLSLAELNSLDYDQLRERFNVGHYDARSPSQRVIDALDLPHQLITNTLAPGMAARAREHGDTGSFGIGRVTGADMLDELGVHNGIIKGVGGLGLDLALDPLTYIGPPGWGVELSAGAGKGAIASLGLRAGGKRAFFKNVEALASGSARVDARVARMAAGHGYTADTIAGKLAAGVAPEDIAGEINDKILGPVSNSKLGQKAAWIGHELDYKGGSLAQDVLAGAVTDQTAPELADRIRAAQEWFAEYGRGTEPGVKIGRTLLGQSATASALNPAGPGPLAMAGGSAIAHIPFTDWSLQAPAFTRGAQRAMEALHLYTDIRKGVPEGVLRDPAMADLFNIRNDAVKQRGEAVQQTADTLAADAEDAELEKKLRAHQDAGESHGLSGAPPAPPLDPDDADSYHWGYAIGEDKRANAAAQQAGTATANAGATSFGDAPLYAPPGDTPHRDRVMGQLKAAAAARGIGDDVVEAAKLLYDRRAKTATERGQYATPDQWWESNWNKITDEEPPAGTLPQGQDHRGMIQFQADGSAVMRLLKGADASTILHETGHLFTRELMMEGGPEPDALEHWAGVQDGKWGVDAYEKVALAGEKYFSTGEAPAPELEGVFQKFKGWLADIYHKIIGSPLEKELAPEARRFFDYMLGKDFGTDEAHVAEDIPTGPAAPVAPSAPVAPVAPAAAATKEIDLGGMGGAISEGLTDLFYDSLRKTGKVPPLERNTEAGRRVQLAWDDAKGGEGPQSIITRENVAHILRNQPAPVAEAKVAAPAAVQAAPLRKGTLSRNDLRNRILDRAGHMADESDLSAETVADGAQLGEAGMDSYNVGDKAGFSSSFDEAELPPDVRETLDGKTNLLRLVKTGASSGGGWRSFLEMGPEAWLAELERRAGSRLSKTVAHLRANPDADPVAAVYLHLLDAHPDETPIGLGRQIRSLGKELSELRAQKPGKKGSDPWMRHKAQVQATESRLDALQQRLVEVGALNRPKVQEAISQLPPGSTFEISGEPFYVRAAPGDLAHNEVVYKGGVVPYAELMDEVPIDAGSVRPPGPEPEWVASVGQDGSDIMDLLQGGKGEPNLFEEGDAAKAAGAAGKQTDLYRGTTEGGTRYDLTGRGDVKPEDIVKQNADPTAKLPWETEDDYALRMKWQGAADDTPGLFGPDTLAQDEKLIPEPPELPKSPAELVAQRRMQRLAVLDGANAERVKLVEAAAATAKLRALAAAANVNKAAESVAGTNHMLVLFGMADEAEMAAQSARNGAQEIKRAKAIGLDASKDPETAMREVSAQLYAMAKQSPERLDSLLRMYEASLSAAIDYARAVNGPIDSFLVSDERMLSRLVMARLGVDDPNMAVSVLAPMGRAARRIAPNSGVPEVLDGLDRFWRNTFGVRGGYKRGLLVQYKARMRGAGHVMAEWTHQTEMAVGKAMIARGVPISEADKATQLLYGMMFTEADPGGHLYHWWKMEDGGPKYDAAGKLLNPSALRQMLDTAQAGGWFDKTVHPGFLDDLRAMAKEHVEMLKGLGDQEMEDNLLGSLMAGYVPIRLTPEAQPIVADMVNNFGQQPGKSGASGSEFFQRQRSTYQTRFQDPGAMGKWRRFFEFERYYAELPEARIQELFGEDPKALAAVTETREAVAAYDAAAAADPAFAQQFRPLATDPWELNDLWRDGYFRPLTGNANLPEAMFDTNPALITGARMGSHQRAAARQTLLQIVEASALEMDSELFQKVANQAGASFKLRNGVEGRVVPGLRTNAERSSTVPGLRLGDRVYRQLDPALRADLENPLMAAFGERVHDLLIDSTLADKIEDVASPLSNPGTVEQFLRVMDKLTGWWKIMTLSHPSWMMFNTIGDSTLALLGGGARPQDFLKHGRNVYDLVAHESDAEHLRQIVFNVRGSKMTGEQLLSDARAQRVADNALSFEQAKLIFAERYARMPTQGPLMNTEGQGTPWLGGMVRHPSRIPGAARDISDDFKYSQAAWAAARGRDTAGIAGKGAAAGAVLSDRWMRWLIAPWFNLNQKAQNATRLMTYLSFLEQGNDTATAARRTLSAVLDYGDFTRVEEKFFRRMIPFYSWVRGNLGYQMQLLFKNPVYAAMAPKAREAIEQATAGEAAVPENHRPAWMRDQLAVQVGSDPDSRWAYMLAQGLPQTDIYNVLAPVMGADGVQQFMHYFTSNLNPTMTVLPQIGAGREFFSDRSIGPAGEADIGIGEFLKNQLRPAAEYGPGGTVPRAFGRSVGQGVGRVLLGGRVQPFDQGRIDRGLQREYSDKVDRLRGAIRKAEATNDTEGSLVARAKLMQLFQAMMEAGLQAQVPKAVQAQLRDLSGSPAAQSPAPPSA